MRGLAPGTDLADELLEDAVAAGVTLLLELLEDLLRGVGMALEQGCDLAFEGVEFAGAALALALLVSWALDPLLDRLGIELQLGGDLGGP